MSIYEIKSNENLKNKKSDNIHKYIIHNNIHKYK